MPLPGGFLRNLLAHPLGAALELDDPATTEARRRIIAEKPFLHAIYREWYAILSGALPNIPGAVVELGSGPGFCAQFVPGLITSELFPCSNARIVMDAQRLPFSAASLRGMLMTNVLHHMPAIREFFAEAARCLLPGGKVLMIEPWVTLWSRFVYRRFHNEHIDTDTPAWEFNGGGPLSAANIALPWMIFSRDRAMFEQEFPDLVVEQIRPFMPFRYIVSGGVSLRSLMPGFTHRAWAGIERLLEARMPQLAMFAFIALRRR